MTIPWMMNCPHNGDGWCLKCVQEMRADVERLEAIVAKLPKTADGVPVVPGMSVWYSSTEMEEWVIRSIRRNDLLDEPLILGLVPADCDGGCTAFGSQVYSTREAAEAGKDVQS